MRSAPQWLRDFVCKLTTQTDQGPRRPLAGVFYFTILRTTPVPNEDRRRDVYMLICRFQKSAFSNIRKPLAGVSYFTILRTIPYFSEDKRSDIGLLKF